MSYIIYYISEIFPIPKSVKVGVPDCESLPENDHILNCLVLNQEEQNDLDGLLNEDLEQKNQRNLSMRSIDE